MTCYDTTVAESEFPNPDRLLIVLPSWVGDVVMATPALRALRHRFPESEITCLLKPYVRPVLDDAPWHDRLTPSDSRSPLALAARLRRHRFDAAVLLPNSFRSALTCALAGIGRRVGYARDGRGMLLTDRLRPAREGRRFVPVPMIDYYLALAGRLGAEVSDRRMELFTSDEDERRADRLLREAGVDDPGRPLVLLNPGAANHGDAKLWPAERFAAVADALIDRHNAAVLVNGSPKERALLDRVHAAARHPLIDLPALGGDLALLKSIARRCRLVLTNDTGARHIAVATGAPTLSLFGPTDPEWTRLDADHERILRANQDCPACHTPGKRHSHTCMSAIEVDTVLHAAEDMLRSHSAAVPTRS